MKWSKTLVWTIVGAGLVALLIVGDLARRYEWQHPLRLALIGNTTSCPAPGTEGIQQNNQSGPPPATHTSSSNTLGIASPSNTLGAGPSPNTLGAAHSSNTLGAAPSSNTLGTAPSSNTLGTAPFSNTLRTAPSSNALGTAPSSNTLGTAPSSNTLATSPSSPYPDWWLESWQRSEVFRYQDQMVNDKGLFPPCKDSQNVVSAYDFVEPKAYLPNSKNPCWYDGDKLKCLPYMYLAGVAKCGTSDISRRLRIHTDILKGRHKEYHWWERQRFGTYDRDDSEAPINSAAGVRQTFEEYVNDVTGKHLFKLKDELQLYGSSNKTYGDFSPSYFWDPQNWHAIEGNQGCDEPRIIVGQHIYHVFPEAKILMIFRHPTPRLYSRFMSRLHRSSSLKAATPEDFHRWVEWGVKVYNDCFRKYSIRQCTYNSTIYRVVKIRLVEGMYPVFMADWLRVWPRDQMLLMRTEDYAGHEKEHILDIISFLGLGPYDKEHMEMMLEHEVVNTGVKEYDKYGYMLPETKKLLDEFYQPFIQMFYELLGEERFLWKDVYQ